MKRKAQTYILKGEGIMATKLATWKKVRKQLAIDECKQYNLIYGNSVNRCKLSWKGRYLTIERLFNMDRRMLAGLALGYIPLIGSGDDIQQAQAVIARVLTEGDKVAKEYELTKQEYLKEKQKAKES
jgi:hypothetical protein